MEEAIKRVVIKIGTNVLTNKDNRILGPVLRELVRQTAVLYERNIEVILVSSGSTIAGKEVLGETSIKDAAIRRQVYSSVGQPRMMRHYYSIFHDYGMRCAQVLATKRDFDAGNPERKEINLIYSKIFKPIRHLLGRFFYLIKLITKLWKHP